MPDPLLVVEDDETIRESLRSALEAAGHQVVAAATAQGALTAAQRTPARLVLLDLGLPDADGFTTCRQLRRLLPRAVIVVLTARHEELDVVAALESGADDYLFKPFKVVEVLARLRAHLRRAEGASQGGADAVLTVGDLVVDPRSRTARVGSAQLQLRNREFDLLARLALEPGVALRRESLMADVWDEEWDGPTKTLDVHVLALRRKLAEAATRDGTATAPVITTLRGHGYRMDRQDSDGGLRSAFPK